MSGTPDHRTDFSKLQKVGDPGEAVRWSIGKLVEFCEANPARSDIIDLTREIAREPLGDIIPDTNNGFEFSIAGAKFTVPSPDAEVQNCIRKEGKDTSRFNLRELPAIVAIDIHKFNRAQIDWSDPLPLPLKPKLPDVTPDMLPPVLRDFAVCSAEEKCGPLAFSATPLLASLGGVIGSALGLKPLRESPYIETPNIWGLIVGPPSALKSPFISTGTALANHVQKDALLNAAEADKNRQQDIESKKDDLNEVKNKMRRTSIPDDVKQRKAGLVQEIKDLESSNAPFAEDYIIGDCTYEGMCEVLYDNPAGTIYHRDEVGHSLLIMFGRWIGTRPLFLEGWTGTGSVPKIARAKALTRTPERNTITVVGGTTEGMFLDLIKKNDNKDIGSGVSHREDGLLQRFQLLFWFPSMADYHYDVKNIPPLLESDQAYLRALRVFKFAQRLRSNCTSHQCGAGLTRGGFSYLRFDSEAQDVYDEWMNAWTNKLRVRSGASGELPPYPAHLQKYPTLVCGLALIFHICFWIEDGENQFLDGALPQLPPVSLEALELALRWIETTKTHARAIYQEALVSNQEATVLLGTEVAHHRIEDGLNLSQLSHLLRGGPLRDYSVLRMAIAGLEEIGWVQLKKDQQPGSTGRPGLHLWINPKISPAILQESPKTTRGPK